jgi:hypothetical protein
LETKNKKTELKLNLNIDKDDAELNDYLYCWQQFGARPNKILIHNTYSTKLFNELINKYLIDKNYFTEIIPSDDNFIINDKMFVKIDDFVYCSYIVLDRQQENSIVNEIIFFYKSSEDFNRVQKIIEELNGCLISFEEDDQSIVNTISLSNNGLELEPIDICDADVDNFSAYYPKSIFKDINKLIKDIKASLKGLSIIYGEKGTGKTSIINYLATKLDRIVIYIPNNMIENTINNPEFRKFLKRFYRSVIVIDDCEMLFGEFFQRSNIFANNLLQMIDGFLSDTIEVNIVTIFNLENEDEIDEDLLDANNLLRVIKFDYLSPEEATELSEHLGNNKQYKAKALVLDVVKNKKSTEKREIGL